MSNCDDNLKPTEPTTSTSGIRNNKPSSILPQRERTQRTTITKGQKVTGGITAVDLTEDGTVGASSGSASGGGGAGQTTSKGGVTGSSSQAQASAAPAKTKEEIQKEKQKKNDQDQVTQSNKQWTQPETEHGRKQGEEIEGKDLYPNQEKKSKEFKPVSIYPFNKTYQTESGHVFETDDTPGSERLSVFHRSGTNLEVYPNGDFVEQHVRDSYFHVFRDQYVHLGGYSSVTVDKGLKILINDDEEENSKEENVNFDIHVAGNANVNIYIHKGNMNVSLVEGDANIRLNKGDVNIRQDKGNYNHTVAGDYNLEVGGHMHVVVAGDVVNEIGGNRDERIDGEFDQKYLSNSSGYLGEYLLGDKRTYVGGNQITEVNGNINEKGQHKKQELQSQEKSIYGSFVTKTGGNWWLASTASIQIDGLSEITIKAKKSMDIFGAEYTGKFRLYSGNSLEIIGEKFTVLRSATDKIELKTPKDVTLKTPLLYKPDDKKAPPFSPDPKPINLDNPSQYETSKPSETELFMKNNKKEWTPTGAKNS
jgi:hypothetical protein